MVVGIHRRNRHVSLWDTLMFIVADAVLELPCIAQLDQRVDTHAHPNSSSDTSPILPDTINVGSALFWVPVKSGTNT